MAYSVAILTISDTAFKSDELSPDISGPALRNRLSSLPNSPYTVVGAAIVPDEEAEIQRVVKEWCDQSVDLVLTTGGTGFGVRDVTPEALTPLIHKPAPGLVALMLSHSLSITPLAALSRPVAGVRLSAGSGSPGTLIISLPGSPKGATENFDSLTRVLPHALDLARGGTGRAVHAALSEARATGGSEEAALNGQHIPPVPSTSNGHTGQSHGNGHSHGHHHHHNHSHADHHHHGNESHGHVMPRSRTILSRDPSIAAAARQRQSPYPLVPIRDAMSLIFENTYVTVPQNLAVTEELVGSVLAEDILSEKDKPELPSTNVDGYAVRSGDIEGVYQVLTEFPLGTVPDNFVYRINTGAPLPPAFDSVIMVEDTEVVSRSGAEEREVRLLAQVDKGENVRDPGSDVRSGEKVLEKGDVISPVGGELGTLAFVGRRSAFVHRRPIVAVLSTGNEIVDVLDTETRVALPHTAMSDSNRPSLISVLQHLHFNVIDLGITRDTMEETTHALKKGREQADVIISTGGTSMGVGDLLKPCIETQLGGTVHFGRVAMKPGKPTTFATIPAHPMAPVQSPRLVFALPGNPAGALCTFFLFVLPALRKMEGRRADEWELPRLPVQLSSPIYLDSRPEYHRVSVRPVSTRTGTVLKAFSTGGQRSSRTVSLAGSNGLLELPAKGDKERFEEGEVVNCVLVGEIGSLLVV